MLEDGLAKEVAEDLLHRTGVALASDDAESFVACFLFPQVIETTKGARVLYTPDELKEVFYEVRDYHRETGASNLVRTVVTAEFAEPRVILSTHVSHHLKACGAPSGKPYPALSVLRYKERAWKIESCVYVVLEDQPLNEALLKCGEDISKNNYL